jgi:N-sulfoglucosamine sulfohydrolase
VKPGAATTSLLSSIDIAPTLLSLAGVPVPAAVQGTSFAAVLADPTAAGRDHVIAEKNWHDFDDHARAVRTAKFKFVRNSYTDIPLTPPADAVRSPTFRAMRTQHAAGTLPAEQRTSFTTPRPAEELYDLSADPHELKNVASDPAHREALASLRAALDRWAKATDDRVPAKRTPDGFDRATGERVKK